MIEVPRIDGESVSRRGSLIPKKLKQDAIVEALFELRFETTTQSEFLFVHLADFGSWKQYSQSRLPAYSIPEQLRKVDPNLQYQPIFELSEPTKQRSVRIGPNVLSYHLRSPYIGWASYYEELKAVTGVLFQRADALKVSRLGLRYLNVLTSDHGVWGIPNLDISVRIGDDEITSGMNINVTRQLSDDISCTVRVATPDFITGALPPNASILADIDVFTRDSFRARDQADVIRWIDEAHSIEKQEFFVLLTDQLIESLEEK